MHIASVGIRSSSVLLQLPGVFSCRPGLARNFRVSPAGEMFKVDGEDEARGRGMGKEGRESEGASGERSRE